MTRTLIAALAFTGLAAVATLTTTSDVAAQSVETDCSAVHERLQQRLETRLRPSFIKHGYASALAGAYERCRAGDAAAWDRIGRILS